MGKIDDPIELAYDDGGEFGVSMADIDEILGAKQASGAKA